MRQAWKRWSGIVLLGAAALLSGCASTWTLDNSVKSFSGLPTLPANPTYRFERLPLQQQEMAGQAQLEALADPALHRAGLRRDDAAPRYSVQLSARAQRVLSPWADPWDWGPGWGGWGVAGSWGHRPGWGVGIGWGGPWGRMEQPWWQREVGVVVRELASGQVVFESRAANDGPWWDTNTVLAAMFEAAMQGFPNPPPGVRRVDVVVSDTARRQPPPTATVVLPPAPPAQAAPPAAR